MTFEEAVEHLRRLGTRGSGGYTHDEDEIAKAASIVVAAVGKRPWWSHGAEG